MTPKEFEDAIERFVTKMVSDDLHRDNQLKRLRKSKKFVELTTKAIQKYSSEAYRGKWHRKGIEPPETLFWFLWDYVRRYGKEATEAQYQTHDTDFTAALYHHRGYWFRLLRGQGSKIIIFTK